jgi:hypothetical protein
MSRAILWARPGSYARAGAHDQALASRAEAKTTQVFARYPPSLDPDNGALV